MFEGIDLYSDTVTRPTPAMKKAMLEASLGDEQRGEDPTTLELEKRVAKLLGMESALFFPSATMANQVAILNHCGRGDEILAADTAHIFVAESGGPAAWAGAMARPIPTRTGIFTGRDLHERFSPGAEAHRPESKLVVVENTTNFGGGIAWPLRALEDVWQASRELGLKTHLDGSRFFNAAAATSESPARLVAGFDTVTLCLSKGLGCAAGALLAFPSRDWRTIRRWKQRLGGSLRQSGMLAAAGLYALEHHLDRLKEDHSNARRLAQGLTGVSGIEVETPEPSTNMVFFRLQSRVTAEQWEDACRARGFRFSHVGPNRYRAVTHLHISSQDIEKVVHGIKEISAKW